MANEESKRATDPQSLSDRPRDYVAAAVRAILGEVPFAGSLLIELTEQVVPNQRIDRIAKFAVALEERFSTLEQAFVRAQLHEASFSAILEEGVRQAARSQSDERRTYIAEVVLKGLDPADISRQETLYILKLLDALSDAEVIWLRSFVELSVSPQADTQFRETHDLILRPAGRQDQPDRAALQDSYKQHLVQLGLLDKLYALDSRTKQPEFDRSTGAQKISGYQLTPLGRLFLREIGLRHE